MSKLLILTFGIILLAISFVSLDSFDKIQLKQSTGRQIQIYRDDNGIPHIFAYSQQDALFGKGYAEAQDRLWDLMMKKFLVQGRISELFGRQGLASDYYARNFKFHDVGVMNAKLLDEQTRKKAQAYCDGINYYAKNTKFLPIQFYIFWLDWQNWTIQDSLGLLTFTTFSLQYDYMYQLARQRLLQTVGFQLAYQIINFGSKTLFRQTTIIKEDELKQLGLWKQYDKNIQNKILQEHWANKKTSLGSVHLPTFEYEGSGSNAWIIGGKHTQNGKPILSNDPHLASLAPPAFYVCQMGIYDQQGNVRIQTFGASMSGIPAISSGMNKIRAWGPTASYVDNKDLFYQTVRIQNNSFQYFHQNQWKNFSSRQQIYKVRWQGQINRTMYQNHRGPVLQDIFDELYYKFSYPMPMSYRINHTITLDSALYRPDPYSLSGLINLTFTQDGNTFVQSGKNIRFPNMDTVYINSTGDFGYVAVGQYPIRQIHEMSGFIKDGRVSTFDMKGFLYNKPQLHNPKRGYLAMCNNKFAPDQYLHRGSQSMISSGRSYRLDKIIKDKIASGNKFTLQDMKKMQLDTKDEFLSQAFPLVLKKLQTLRYIWSNQKTQKFFNLLKNWDYFMQKDSIQTTIYHVWQRLLQSSFLTETDLNEQEREAIINHLYFQNYQLRLFQKIHHQQLTEQQSIVCSNHQNRNYTQLHPCQASIGLAFKKIPQQIQKIFGTDDITQYKWGTIHKATFKAIPFSQIPVIGKIWERQTPHGGNSRTLNLGVLTHQSKGDNKYRSVASPVFRFMTDLNTTYWSLDLGNSGNLFSKYYDNFMGKDQYFVHSFENPKARISSNWKQTVG